MKKIICMILVTMLVISLTACGSSNNNTPNSSSGASESGNGAEPSASAIVKWQPRDQTERTEQAQATYQQVLGDMGLSLYETNPDYADIINNFIYGDIYNQNDLLDLRQRELITLVSLTANQSYDLLRQHVQGALNLGLTPEEIMEAIYHCTPYTGIATTYSAVTTATKVLLENGVSLPLESQRQVDEDDRYDGGARIQSQLYGMNPVRGDQLQFLMKSTTSYA